MVALVHTLLSLSNQLSESCNCIHEQSCCEIRLQRIPIYIFVQKIPRPSFTKCSIPERLQNISLSIWFKPYWKNMQETSIYYYHFPIQDKRKKKCSIFLTYHWGTNGAIQITSPAWTGYLFMKILTENKIRKI